MNAGSLRSAAHQARPLPRSSETLPIRSSYGSPAARRTRLIALDEIDEAGVHAARVGEQAHDSTQHLVELERRGDGRDDPRENVVAACGDRCHAGIVERDDRVKADQECAVATASSSDHARSDPAAASPSATKPGRRHTTPPPLLPGEPGHVGAERAARVVDPEIERRRGAAVDPRHVADAELRRRVAREHRPGDAGEPEHEKRQHVRQRQQQPGGRERDRAERESPPADAIGEAAGERPEQDRSARAGRRGWRRRARARTVAPRAGR